MDLIYCAGGNKRLATIAIEEGFLYGSRSDDIRDLRCNGLIDVNWKNYSWLQHITAIREHIPKYAVVPDVFATDQLERAKSQAKEIAAEGSTPIIVPKADGLIEHFSLRYLVGISVPSQYAGFLPKINELRGRRVHLLGGSPLKQRELWWYYGQMGVTVVSSDINCHNKASDFGSYWNGRKWVDKERETIGKYAAFRKSCRGILEMWKTAGAIA